MNEINKSLDYCRDCVHNEVCTWWPSLNCNCVHRLRQKDTEQLFNSRQWMEFLAMAFGVSHSTAKDMYHSLCMHKRDDNFKKQFNGGKSNER